LRSTALAVVAVVRRGRCGSGRRVRRDGRGTGRRQVVREAVPAQVAVPAEHFAARRAVVRFDVGVRQQVRLQVGPLVEAAAAHRTLVRRLFQVQDLVDGQRARLAEPLAALQTLERFLLGVYVPADTTKRARGQYHKTTTQCLPVHILTNTLGDINVINVAQ